MIASLINATGLALYLLAVVDEIATVGTINLVMVNIIVLNVAPATGFNY